MSVPTIHYAGIDYYDRTRPLVDGSVQTQGFTFRFTPLPFSTHFTGFAEAPEADAIEMSVSQYLGAVGRGDTTGIAIPVFPSRAFRLDGIYVRAGGDVREPADLKGRRVGISNYQRTAALWQRGILAHEFGVSPQDIEWVQSTPTLPPAAANVRIEVAPPGKSLATMLLEGEIDAFFFGPEPPEVPGGAGRIARLFPDPMAVEQEYFRRTGLFPIMHLVVLKRECYERNPEIVVALFNAFEEAKRVGWERVRRVTTPAVMLPWITQHVREIDELFGDDHWPYGLAKNRKVLDAACQFHYEQGLSPRRLQPEELFARETLTLG